MNSNNKDFGMYMVACTILALATTLLMALNPSFTIEDIMVFYVFVFGCITLAPVMGMSFLNTIQRRQFGGSYA